MRETAFGCLTCVSQHSFACSIPANPFTDEEKADGHCLNKLIFTTSSKFSRCNIIVARLCWF